MKELYTKAEYSLPRIIPKALGKVVNIICFLDSDHTGNHVTH